MISSDQIETFRARIMAKTEPEPYSGCWIWTGGYTGGQRAVQNRPAIWIGTRVDFASRVSFWVFKSPIPDGLFVCHKCDTPACVNPAHLFLGDASANMRDMYRKMRGRPAGRDQKLSDAAIREILSAIPKYGYLGELAVKFHVEKQTICHVRNGTICKNRI